MGNTVLAPSLSLLPSSPGRVSASSTTTSSQWKWPARPPAKKKIDGAIGYGLAGALVLGPVGAAAGVMLAGEEKEITFLTTFKDGRKILAAADDRTYQKLSQHIATRGLARHH